MTAIEVARDIKRLLSSMAVDEVANHYELAYTEEHARVEARDKLLDIATDALHDICERNENEKPAYEIASNALDTIDTLRKEGR